MEFHRLDFEGDLDEMEVDELRATLAEFKEKHDENTATFDSLVEDLPDTDEYESLKEENAEFKQKLAGDLAEFDHVLLSEEELLNFSLARLAEMSEKAAEFAQEAPEDDEGEEVEEGPAFTQESKESVTGDFSDDALAQRRQEARSRLSGMAGLAFE